jgi:anti-anti-sigma factor
MAPQDMIEVEIHSDSASILTLRGERDLASKPALTSALVAACFRPNVVIDLSECMFIDSSVISALLGAVKRRHQSDGRLELVIPPGARAIRRVLEVMSVERILPIHETCAAAIDCVGSAPGPHQDGREAPAATGKGLRLRAISEPIEESRAGADSRKGASERWA